MDSLSEQEKRGLTVVELDKPFYPFAEGKIQFGEAPKDHPFQNVPFPSTNLLFKFLEHIIPMTIYLEPGDRPRQAAIQPFAPEKGYTITTEDFNAEQREKKLRKAINSTATLEEAGGYLIVRIDGKDLERLNLAQRNPDRQGLPWYIFKDKETEQLFCALCCNIEISGLRFTAKPDYTPGVSDAGVWIYIFHPIDTPPLPPTNFGMEGNNILLSCSLEKLSKLEMCLTLQSTASKEDVLRS